MSQYAAQLSHFSKNARHCPRCLQQNNITVDQHFLHSCLYCPQVLKLYERTAQIFGFSEVLPIQAKDVLVWKRFYKSDIGNERNLAKEYFFKMINMSIHAHINQERINGSFPTLSSLVNKICNTIVNILVHFKQGKLGLTLSKQKKLCTREAGPALLVPNIKFLRVSLNLVSVQRYRPVQNYMRCLRASHKQS